MENNVFELIKTSKTLNLELSSKNIEQNFCYAIEAIEDLNLDINLSLINNSEISINILVFSFSDSIVKIDINSISNINNAKIKINVYGFSFDSSRIIFKISSEVNKALDNVVIQNIFGLLMSKDSMITGEPILKINTEQIIAKHSLRIGSIDKEELFYLQSKGFSIFEAKKILINSMIYNLLISCNSDEFTSNVINIINRRF